MDKKYIRFIDSHYNTLFHVANGDSIRIKFEDGDVREYPCRYIDETHAHIGINAFHICEFAERMERNGNTYEPVKEIGDLEFYKKRFYDRDNLDSEGKPVPYYELLTVKQGNFEFKFNYCLSPATADKTFFLFKEHAFNIERNEKAFAENIAPICSDEKIAVRLQNIVQSIQEEEVRKTRNQLPERCYGILPSSGEIVIIARGEDGYYNTDFSSDDPQFNKQLVEEYNEKLGVSKAQAAAMSVGSMFGWDVPGANPDNYDENGKYKRESLSDKIVAAEKTKHLDDSNTNKDLNEANRVEVR